MHPFTTKKQLFSVWPYLGGVFCVITLLPHLLWSAENDWLSWRFQLGRGFVANYDNTEFAADHPKNAKPTTDSLEFQLADSLKSPEEVSSKVSKPDPLSGLNV